MTSDQRISSIRQQPQISRYETSGGFITKSGTTTPLASSITYEPFGGVKSLTNGNSLSLSQEYDNQYRISSIITGSVLNLAYTYYPDGSVWTITDNINPPMANTSGIPGTYSYVPNTNKLNDITGPPATTYSYDNNGNIITENNRTFVYDLSNQITSILDNSTQIAAYTYNGLRQRTKKVAGSDTTIYHYDTQGHLIAETNSSGQTLVEYVYLGDQPLAMIRPTEQVYYYHNDHLGTPQVLTNSVGAVAWKAAYNAFGNATVTVNTVENNLRFPGQYYDTESGLHYNWNRYYDPMTGRYITADPIGLEGGINMFGYVGGNPVNWFDPTGLETFICHRPLTVFKKERWIAYHKYPCVRDEKTGKLTCGGQGTDHWPGPAKGRAATGADGDLYNDKKCRSVEPDDPCMDKCMADTINNSSRPTYGWPTIGTDCKEWTVAVIAHCRKKYFLMNDYEKGLSGK